MISLRRGDCEARITRFDRRPWRTGIAKGNGGRGRDVATSYAGGSPGTSVLLVFRRDSFSAMVNFCVSLCVLLNCMGKEIWRRIKLVGRSDTGRIMVCLTLEIS
jgi:hypothetical protein